MVGYSPNQTRQLVEIAMKSHYRAAITLTMSATFLVSIYPAEAAYLVGTSCKSVGSTTTDPLKNSLTCVKIGKVQIWRSNVDPFILKHATQGIAYEESISAHFIPSPVSLRTPFTYSFGSKIVSPHIGLTVGKNGILRFTPTELGVGEFRICLTDAKRKRLCKNFSLTIDRLVTTLAWNGTNSYILHYPTQGKAYRYRWTEFFTGGPYTYYLVDSDAGSLLGLTMEPEGVLIITPSGITTRKFEVCGKDSSGKKLCKVFTIVVDYLLPDASPSSDPSKAPTTISGIAGKWEGNAKLIQHMTGSNSLFECSIEVLYQLEFTQTGEKLQGQTTQTYLRTLSGCRVQQFPPTRTVLLTHSLQGAITGTKGWFSVIFPPTSTFMGDAQDYTFEIVGNTLRISFVFCHSPDPRCTGKSTTVIGGTTAVSEETIEYFEGELTAVRTNQ